MIRATSAALDTPFIEPLRAALTGGQRCLLMAEPGAGKTTRAPLALLELQGSAAAGRWLLLEPRRVAARLAAGYMAELLGEPLGQTVGYRVRGESRVSRSSRIEVITQGIFTRMVQDDPTLEGVTGVIFDEFHERSLEADLGLALALDVQQLREDLKLLVMSATLDVGALLRVLGEATPVIDCPGRVWPVATFHRSAKTQELPEQLQARVIREALAAHAGNALLFLPGQREIYRLQRLLDAQGLDAEVLPLHGQLSLAEQQAVLRAGKRRRVILSTDIAESSLTVPDVHIVIDAGKERVPQFQAGTGLTRLVTRQVNRASADQRRGRAGRTGPGFCYRLWPAETLLQAHGEPEILQADLAGLLFELVRWGVRDPLQLAWIDPPPTASLARATNLLSDLALLDEHGLLSAFGQRCARWPTHPRLAVILETAAGMDALPLACWLVAWLEEAPGDRQTDIAELLRGAYSGVARTDRRWQQAAKQWSQQARCGLKVEHPDALPTLLMTAWPERVAQNVGKGRFRLASGGQAWLDESDALAHTEFLVAVELDGNSSGARIFHAAGIGRAALQAHFRAAQQWQSRVTWNEGEGRLQGEEVKAVGAVVLERRPLNRLPRDAVVAALMDALRRRGRLSWSDEDRQLIGRLRLLHRELGPPWPDVCEETLLTTLEQWLAPRLENLNRLDQIDALPLGRFLVDALDWPLQQKLEQLAPTHLKVPSGSAVKIDYSAIGQDAGEPVLAVKLQEMFGQIDTPRIVESRVPLLIHLLSPARRPVQVTRDLASFWAGTYFDVRKDLKGRYPRHPWPDDPLQAPATARAKPRPKA